MAPEGIVGVSASALPSCTQRFSDPPSANVIRSSLDCISAHHHAGDVYVDLRKSRGTFN